MTRAPVANIFTKEADVRKERSMGKTVKSLPMGLGGMQRATAVFAIT